MRYYYRSKLKELVTRKYGKLTHDEISRRTGVNRPTITRWLECRPEDLYEIIEVDELS